MNVSPTNGSWPTSGHRKTLPTLVIAENSDHPGQSFSLSLCGPNSISRANAHMVYMGRKLALHFTLQELILLKYKCYTANVQKRNPSL